MQKRHTDRYVYFKELAQSCRLYFIPYLEKEHRIEPGMRVLEIGCGDGGNLLPFAEMGCETLGIDLSEGRVEDAKAFFEREGVAGQFLSADFCKLDIYSYAYDIILCHDVLEHIADKEAFLQRMCRSLKPDGIVFMAFPAWQMPFGGHQQICRSGFLSKLPFMHLLPAGCYSGILKLFNEPEDVRAELLDIKKTGVSVESFERLIERMHLTIVNRQLWFVNPHYQTKFGLKPRKLCRLFSGLPYLRNFMTTSCFYLLRKANG
ncbi:MAG: methyltransferase domain-containing protein [Bacteroidales bacterium]|nr:methyltransferase domain-containing protein [Bacteroidales bacterium]